MYLLLTNVERAMKHTKACGNLAKLREIILYTWTPEQLNKLRERLGLNREAQTTGNQLGRQIPPKDKGT
jgi:hypothetical protein